MRIREAVEKNYSALPGYKLVGYSEIAIPVFQRRLQVLVLSKKSIPVVEQFVLNFYKEGIPLDDIKEILGLTQQLIDEAWAGLIQKDYINNFTKAITQSGLQYLKEDKIEKLEKKEIQICIDGLTGKISKNNTQLMIQKAVKEKEIKALKSSYNKIKLEDLDFQSIKRVYKSYQQNDSENYSGDILDVIEMYGNTTRYRRIDVLFFHNFEKDLRILVYDDYNKIEEYEEKLLALENAENAILNYDIDDFINEVEVGNINSIIENSNKEDCEYISLDKINIEWDKYLSSKESEIIIITPLISECKLNKAFNQRLEVLAKEKTRVKYIVSGRDFSSEYQKNNCLSLQELNKFSNFEFKQIPYYLNKMIVNISKSEALVSIYEQNDIISNGSKKGIVEKVYKLKGNAFSNLYNKIVTIINNYKVPELNKDSFGKEQMEKKVKGISELAKDCDSYMYNIDSIGWFGEGGIPDIKRLLEVPIARNSESFRVFVDSFNKSLVESLEVNAKGKGKRKYFWNEFKNQYFDLHKILNKIKTYRNKSNHLKLDEPNKIKFHNYLQDDLNGYLPQFINNGYIILQRNILLELEEAIRKTLISISK